MTTITIPVTVLCESSQEVEKAKEILSRYQFKTKGLIKLDEKIKKKEWVIVNATKDYLIAK